MKKLFLFSIIIFLFNNLNNLKSNEIKIVTKIANEIITNVDIENEYKYLVSLNNDYQKLEKNKIFNIAKASLIREKIKEIELKKYFELGVQDSFLNNKIGELFQNLGFANSDEFKVYLNKFGLEIEDIARKIEIELKWNKLIYDKYKDQIIINKEFLKKKIIEESKDIDIYNISELIFSYETENENENKKKLLEVLNSIDDIGFDKTVLIFSNSESRKNFGSLGWINELSLSQTILEKLKNINVSEITEPIRIQNGILILKLNDKKKANMSVDVDEELRKLIKFETNKQLNVFSTIYFEKIKNKLSINE